LIPKRADLAEFLSTLEFFRDLDEAALRAGRYDGAHDACAGATEPGGSKMC